MRIKWGAYTTDSGECELQIARTPAFSEGGVRIGYTESWHIVGMLLAEDLRSLNAALAALEKAFSADGQDLALVEDDGTATAHRLRSAECAGGTRVVGGVSYPRGDSSEMVTHRTWETSVEGMVLKADVNLLAWTESITSEGGGPLDIHLQTLTGKPQKQRVAEYTPIKVVQEGIAVGQWRYPTPPQPIWPGDEIRPRRRISRRAPKRTGPKGSPQFVEYEISWRYEFESASELQGDPTKQPEQ